MTYFLYPEKYRRKNLDAPVFKQIRNIKKKCEICGSKATAMCNGKVLCGGCFRQEKELLKIKIKLE